MGAFKQMMIERNENRDDFFEESNYFQNRIRELRYRLAELGRLPFEELMKKEWEHPVDIQPFEIDSVLPELFVSARDVSRAIESAQNRLLEIWRSQYGPVDDSCSAQTDGQRSIFDLKPQAGGAYAA